MLPLPRLHDSCSTQGRLPTDSLPAHFEIDPVNEQISKPFGDGPVQPPAQRTLDVDAHPAHLGRTDIAAPEQMRDLPCLTCGDPLKKHLRDDLVDPFILSVAAAHNGAASDSRPSASGQAQILNMTEACFELL